MGEDWKEGLELKYGKEIKIWLNWRVHDTQGNEVGNVDLILQSNRDLCIYKD